MILMNLYNLKATDSDDDDEEEGEETLFSARLKGPVGTSKRPLSLARGTRQLPCRDSSLRFPRRGSDTNAERPLVNHNMCSSIPPTSPRSCPSRHYSPSEQPLQDLMTPSADLEDIKGGARAFLLLLLNMRRPLLFCSSSSARGKHTPL